MRCDVVGGHRDLFPWQSHPPLRIPWPRTVSTRCLEPRSTGVARDGPRYGPT
ncbi:hypothetical protein C791_0906 [Amycolatopsis azurea DSM 43854]|uniref:Uncharacterized protein n=1 Tax=Amycolatopsis azurea DSM 43854 TaxID=1238180 RepID=M2P0J9_9PSEU|nr:hypothetical protein C791_0906 [Amycolatopsis azurea DSM 43854]